MGTHPAPPGDFLSPGNPNVPSYHPNSVGGPGTLTTSSGARAHPAPPGGGVWAEVAGQAEAISTLQAAALAARQPGGRAMTQSWLIVGPPGSGRSVAARAFAAALQCTDERYPGCGRCRACQDVMAATHPDVYNLNTDQVQVAREEIRKVVDLAYTHPSTGRWRIIMVEDYDRVTVESSNILLKALEEPPERTVWLLCAPSSADVLPTIKSRCRLLQLRIPAVGAVAELLVRRNWADAATAEQVAAEAGSHIGRAKALAENPQLRVEREKMIRLVAGGDGVSDAVWAAEAIVKAAEEQAKSIQSQAAQQQRESLLATFGVDDEKQLPPAQRTQLKHILEDQAKRERRAKFDVWDRILEDISSFYRDVLMVQMNGGGTLINPMLRDLINEKAARTEATQTLQHLEAIRQAKRRLARNANPDLALSAMCITLNGFVAQATAAQSR